MWKKLPFFGYIDVPLTKGAESGGDKGLVSSKPPMSFFGLRASRIKKVTLTLVRIQHGTQCVGFLFFRHKCEIIEYRWLRGGKEPL